MQMTRLIRRATSNDLATLRNIRREAILELATAGMPLSRARKWAEKVTLEGMREKFREMEIWIAELNEDIVGWVAFRDDFLTGLYTDPRFANQGIGTELLGFAEGLVRERGFEFIRADASANAEDFYLRRGYEPTGPRPENHGRPIKKRLLN